jgi:hypothetical protein
MQRNHECLNVDEDAPVVLQLTDSEALHMVINDDKKLDDNDDSALEKQETCLQTGKSV